MTEEKPIRNIELIHFWKRLELLNERMKLPSRAVQDLKECIISKIDQEPEIIEKRLKGLYEEDEFLLFSLMLGNLVQITKLDQKRYVSNDYSIPDFLVATKIPFRNEEEKNPLFVEAKKLPEDAEEFVTYISDFNKLNIYTQLYSIPLYFAIKINLPNFSKWLLISADTLVQESKVEERIIRGSRKESAYVANVLELLKHDFLDLWFSNYTVIIDKGFKIIKDYSKIEKSSIPAESLGFLVGVTCEFKEKHEAVVFKEGSLNGRDLLFLLVCKYLARGKEIKEKDDELTKIIYEAESKYIIPFYHVILNTYLHIKDKKQKATDELKASIAYYLESFSEDDHILIALIKDVIFEMQETGLLKLITMIPEHLFPE